MTTRTALLSHLIYPFHPEMAAIAAIVCKRVHEAAAAPCPHACANTAHAWRDTWQL